MANGTTISGMVAWPFDYPRNPVFDFFFGPGNGYGPLPFGLDFINSVGSTIYDAPEFNSGIDDLLAAWVGSPLLAFEDQTFGSAYRPFDYGPGGSGGLSGPEAQDAIDLTVAIEPSFLATRWMTGNPAFVSKTIATLAAYNYADSSLVASEAFFVTDYQDFSNFANIYVIQGADPDYIPRTYSGFTQRTPNLDDVCGQWPAEGFPFFPPQVNRITYVLDPQ